MPKLKDRKQLKPKKIKHSGFEGFSRKLSRTRRNVLKKARGIRKVVRRIFFDLTKQNRAMEWFFHYRSAPPSTVAIETNTACNRRCSYCPNSISDRGAIKNDIRMPVELYTKIMHDLKKLGFKGKISAQFYNEPLLDSRLPDLLALTREILGEAVTLTTSTNGDLLNAETLRKFYDLGMKRLTISIHDPEVPTKLQKLLDKVEAGQIPSPRIHVKLLKSFKGYTNRGGLVDISPYVDEETNRKRFAKGCNKATHMQIDAKGQVILCCNDYFSAHILGHAAKENIADIWKRSVGLRKKIYLGNYELDICRKCASIPEPGLKPSEHPFFKNTVNK